ncbi:MAG: AMP-binding protein [Kangiellaceae bacterium]|nr:AMP-binding protein [Kangiellaceae bacterium]
MSLQMSSLEKSFESIYQQSIKEPNQFWLEAAQNIHWSKPPIEACELNDEDRNVADWFKGGQLNSCYNALDCHVESGFGEQIALIYESPVTGKSQSFSFNELLGQVAVFAGALMSKGIEKGDRVVIYMPMIPQAVIAMLACARIGAVHSVVFGGFAANELAVRIDDALPKAIISASCGIEINRVIDYKTLLDSALEFSSHQPDFQVIFQREEHQAKITQNGDVDWSDFVIDAQPVGCVAVDATDPLYILYTSGTTGKPKGVIRDNGGHCVALKWSMQNIYNVSPGEVFWAASDIGWVVGHSYIVYGPLFNRNTTVLYEGKPIGTPDCNAFWSVIDKYRVGVLFTAPTAIRAIKKEDPDGQVLKQSGCDLSTLKALFLAGERSDPDTLVWAERNLKVPVIDHWWQTETGWSICANCLGIEQLPVVHGSPTRPVPGYQLEAVDKLGNPVSTGQIGALVIKAPLPPGTFKGLWRNPARFEQGYFAKFNGYYETGDAGYIDENGYVFVMSRTDDIINVAGHRLSTGAIEEVIASHPDVAECAVIGVPCELKGEKPVALIVLNGGVKSQTSDGTFDEIQNETIKLVRQQLGAVYSYKSSVVVDGLPKTRSGKVLRGTMKKIAKHEKYDMPATIDDPTTLTKVTEALSSVVD